MKECKANNPRTRVSAMFSHTHSLKFPVLTIFQRVLHEMCLALLLMVYKIVFRFFNVFKNTFVAHTSSIPNQTKFTASVYNK